MTAMRTATDERVFEEHRRLMFGVAYRMLGSVQEAEDVVQDAYLRFQNAGAEPEHPKAYFVTIVTRLSMDRLKSARMQREEYFGTWLPEPLVVSVDTAATPEQAVALEADVSMAFLVMLERLTPAERAVFLLREVFDYDYGDIAPVVQKSEAACRQLFRRARERLSVEQKRFAPSEDQLRTMTATFGRAASEGDMAGLMAILAHDVVVYSDGGGKARAAVNPVFGAEKVARFIIGVAKKESVLHGQIRHVNGEPGLVLFTPKGRPHSVLCIDVVDGRIRRVFAVRNPDKLLRVV